MTMRTSTAARFDGKSISIELDWDDVTGVLWAVHVTNDSLLYDVWARVDGNPSNKGQETYSVNRAAGSGRTTFDLPAGLRKKWTFDIIPDGREDLGQEDYYDTIDGDQLLVEAGISEVI